MLCLYVWYYFGVLFEIECRDSFVDAVGSVSVKSSIQMLLKFAARMTSLWMLLFAGVPSEVGFVRKGESVSLCLSMIIAVC